MKPRAKRVRRTPPRQKADTLFGYRLRHEIQKSGHSMSEVARRIGRSEAVIRKWCRGGSEPNVTDLILLATKVGFSTARLLGVS